MKRFKLIGVGVIFCAIFIFAFYLLYIKLISPYIFTHYESARYNLAGIYISPPNDIKYYDISGKGENGLAHKNVYYKNVAEKGYDKYIQEIKSRPRYYSELVAVHRNEDGTFNFRYVRITEQGIEFDREEKNLTYYDDIKYFPLSTVYYLFAYLGNDEDHHLITMNITPVKNGSWYSPMKPVAFRAPTINPLHWMPASQSNIISDSVFNIEAKAYRGGMSLPKDSVVISKNPTNQDVSEAINKMQNDLIWYVNNENNQANQRMEDTQKLIKGIEEVSKHQNY